MVELNDENFAAAVSEGSVLVDFWAPWCVPCKASLPHFEAFIAANPGLKAAKVNVDEASAALDKMGIQAVPTFVLFENGVEIARHSGAISLALLKSKFGNKT